MTGYITDPAFYIAQLRHLNKWISSDRHSLLVFGKVNSAILFVSGCIGIRLRTNCRFRHYQLPAGRNTQSINKVCAMGVFRSQTPRALWNISRLCHNWALAFHFGRIRPLFLPVSGLIFLLTINWLLLFLSDLFRYPCPYILQISAIRCSDQIPFSRRIHFHSGFYPLIIY